MADPLITPTGYRLNTVAEAFARLQRGVNPWVAIGDFLDDWYVRAQSDETRRRMVRDEIALARSPQEVRWAAFFAAMSHTLSLAYNIGAPAWVGDSQYVLADPWFLAPGEPLRALQLVESPPEFKMRNVFPGDRVLSRV